MTALIDLPRFCLPGNMWGTCTNGTEGLGCGRPETFRNCADVTIVTSTAGLPPIFIGQQDNPFLLYYRDFRSPSLVSPLIIRWVINSFLVLYVSSKQIYGNHVWKSSTQLLLINNCSVYITYFYCRQQVCLPTPFYKRLPGVEEWCQTNCLRYPPNCSPLICQCP